jgi:hypothetical protein
MLRGNCRQILGTVSHFLNLTDASCLENEGCSKALQQTEASASWKDFNILAFCSQP